MNDESVPTSIEQQLAAMRMGVEYQFTIRMRALVMKVRPLSMAEHVQVTNDVAKALMASPPNERNSMNESSMLAKEILKKATKETANTRVESPVSDRFLDSMTSDELMYFYQQYLDGVNALNPAIDDVTDEKIIGYVDAAKKNNATLSDLSRPVLVKVALSLLTPTG